MKSGISVIGACNTDMITYVSHLPRPGETIKGNNFQTGFGGKGANQAIQIAKLAHIENFVRFIGKIGQDSIGQATKANFVKHLVDVEHLLVAEDASVPSGVAAISVDDKGENSIVIIGGANDLLTPDEARAAVLSPVHSGSQYLLVQLEVSIETSFEAMRTAKELGIKVVLNTAPAQKLPSEILSICDIVIPNQGELSLLTDLPTETHEQIMTASQSLLALGAQAVLCTLGAEGAMYVSSHMSRHFPVPPECRDVHVVDTVGAGDCFAGSLVFFLACGLPIELAIGRANRVAAISVTKKGTQSSYPFSYELPTELFEGCLLFRG